MLDKAVRNAQSTTANYIVCERFNASGLTEVSTSIVSASVLPYILNDNFSNKAAVTINQLFCPISNVSGGVFPHMESPTYPIDRFDYGFIPTTGSGQVTTSTSGNVTKSGEYPTDEFIINKEGSYKRSVGFTMPMYGAGRGLDTNGDIVGGSGESDILEWKAGPIDLRWDDSRKVWSSGPTVIEGYLSSDITPATARNQPSTFYIQTYRLDGSGNYVTDEMVELYNYDLHLSIDLQTKCVYTSGNCTFEDEDIFVVAIDKGGRKIPIYIGCTNE